MSTGLIPEFPAVYFDVVEPRAGAAARPPVILIHGGAHTGSCYLRTVDGRPGWAHRFAGRGWRAIVPDWPGHGRSGAVALERIDAGFLCEGLAAFVREHGPAIVLTHSMSGALGWRILEAARDHIVALVGIAPGPPGNIQPAAELVEDRADAYVVRTPQRTLTISKTYPSVADPAFVAHKLVGASTRFPRALLDDYAASLISIVPRVLLQRQNTGGTQVRVHDPARLAGARVLVVTGSDDFDHPRDIDEPIVDWLNACGARAEFVWLPDRGITGNGHMLMLEDNSDEIADLVIDWLDALPPASSKGSL